MATQATAGWQLDEAGAETYEQFLVTAFMDDWAGDLIERLEVGPGDRVLDVATGTGIVARHAARRVGRDGTVAGTDVNPAMLAVARRLAPDVRFEHAPADDQPFPDGSFDVVTCQQALQFFPDRPAFLAEVRRLTTPGARVGVGTCGRLDHQPGYRTLVDVVTEHIGVEAGAIIASPYAFGVPDDLRSLFTEAGFEDVHVDLVVSTFRAPSAEAFLRGEMASSPLGDVIATLDGDVVTGLIDDLTRRLDGYRVDDGIVFPFETAVATATR